MSRNNIDERIVEMQFQNRQFEEGVHTSIKSLSALKQSLNFDGAEKSLQNLERSTRHFSMDGLAGAVEAVSGKFSAMEVVAITALQRITNKAIDTGERLIKSLSVDQIMSGFNKYTDKTKSVNTIMNATGESIDYVNERLDKLNWFTDETSYNFTDMVSNIGKFTSAGVSLDDATTAMMGIATEAALSGQGINEASRAMYNFAQAIGAGQVKLMDWRSIENANMGTKEFKQTIIDTAVAMGKLKRGTSGTVKTVKGTTVTFQNFNETLSENWFTSEVLIESLRKYGAYAEEVYKVATRDGITAAEAMEKIGDADMELGAKAFKAAQVARTFTDAIEATKDAVSSGWMRSFELIFGDVNESAELWTDATNALWEVFAAGAESRNEVLKTWHDAAEGGRSDLLEGVYDAFEALWNIVTSVKEALANVFPVDWDKKLQDITLGVKEFGANLKKTFGVEDVVVGQETVDIIESLPNKVEKFDKALQRGARGEGVKQMQERLQSLSYDLGSAGVDGIFGPKTEAALKAFEESAGLIMDGIYDEADHMEIMKALFGTHEKVVGTETVDIIEQQLSPALEKVKTLAEGFFSVFHIGFRGIEFGLNILGEVGSALSPLGDAFLDIGLAVASSITGFDQWLGESGKLESALASVKEFLVPVREWAEQAAKSLLKFFGIGDGTAAGKFTEFIYGILSSLSGLSSEKLQSLGFLESLGLAIDNLKNKIKETEGFKTFTNAIDRIKKVFASVIPVVRNFFEQIGGKVSEKIGSFWGWLAEKIPEGAGNVLSFFADIIEKLTPYVSKLPSLIDKIKLFAVSLPQIIRDFLANFPSIKDVWTTVRSFFSSIFGGSDKHENSLATESTKKSPFEIGLERFGKICSKIYELLPLIAAIGGAVLILAAAAKAIKLVTNLLNAFTTAKYGYKDVQKRDSLPNAILKLAAAIGIIAGSIYLISSIGDSEFVRAATTVGIIAGALVAIAVAFGKIPMNSKGIADVGDGLLKLSLAIGVIAGIMWLFGNANPSTIAKGGAVVAAIMALLGVFVVALSKLGVSSLSINGLVKMAVAVGILGAIAWIAGNMNGRKALKGLAIIGTIMLMMGLFAKNVGTVGGVQIKGLVSLAASVYILALAVKKLGSMDLAVLGKGLGAVTILGAVFAGIAAVFGAFSTGIKVGPIIAIALGLAAIIGVFGYVIDQIRDVDPMVMVSFASSLVLTIGGLTAAVIAANKLGGGIGGMASGAAGIGAAFAIIAAITTAVVGGLGLIDEATNGGLTSVIEDGGKVLRALVDALTPYDDLLKDGMLAVGLISAAAIGGIAGPGIMIGGAAVITLAFGTIVGIATAIIAGIGALNTIPGAEGMLVEKIDAGGEVFKAIGHSLAQFGHGFTEVVTGDITDFGTAVRSAREAISGIGYDANSEDGGQLGQDLAVAFGFVTSIRDFLAGLTPYDTNVTYPELGTYTSAANQLSTDMDAFSIAIGDLRSSITGISDGMLTDNDIQMSIDLAAKMHDFFEGIKPYDVTPLPSGGYLTAPEQLSTDMGRFGDAISAFSQGVGNIATDYPSLYDNTQTAIKVAGEVSTFFSGLTVEYETLSSGQVNYSAFRQKVVDLTDNELTQLSTSLSGYATRLQGISKSTIEDDTEKALSVVGQVSSFLAQANELAIPTNQNAFQKIFGTKNKVESLFEDLGKLGDSMLQAKTGIATLGSAESTFDADFSSAMTALTIMAEFLDGVSELTIESKGVFEKFFTGGTAQDTVFDSVSTLGNKMKEVGGKISGLGGGEFEKDFAAAMRALNSMATFMDRIGKLRDEGHLGGDVDFNTVLFPIKNLGDTIAWVAESASSIDLATFSSIVETITAGYAKVAEGMVSVAEFAGGAAIETALQTSVQQFCDAGAQISSGLAESLDGAPAVAAVNKILTEMVSAAAGRASEFTSVGANCAIGLGAGLSSMSWFVESAAASVMRRAIAAAKAVAEQHSPSRVFREIGMNNDLGLAIGMREYGYVVEASAEDVSQSAIDTTGSMLSKLASLVTEDMDTTPTIRPVMDLSDVSNGVAAMNGLFGSSQRYTPSLSYSLANSAASSGYARPVVGGSVSAGFDDGGIRAEIRELKQAILERPIVMDSDGLVVSLGPKMDSYLGKQKALAKRR